MSYPTELTPAQQAAAEFLRDIHAARQGLPAEITPDIRAEARAVVAAVRPHLATEPPVHDDIHHYLSTGCLHGEMTLPDGRTGHQYCQGHTGNAGTKKPASCKFCQAPCWCECHKTNGREDQPMTDQATPAPLTAHAPTDLARLLAEIDRLGARIDRLLADLGHARLQLAEARTAPHEPATATGALGPDPSEGTAPTGPQEPTQAAVDTIARILVGTDWDEEVPYTDIGPRETVAHLARRIIAATHEAEGAPERVDTTTAPGGAAPGPAPLTLAQAAGHLHDWARDLADGTRTDWPAGHADVIRGIRAAADWLDARSAYETEARDTRDARPIGLIGDTDG